MTLADLHISSDAGLQDSNGNVSNVDEIVAQMIADSRIDAIDKIAIDNLHRALTTQKSGLFTQSREALKGILFSVLQKGYDVKGLQEREQLQKILKIAGLDYDLDAIYTVNQILLRTSEVTQLDFSGKNVLTVSPKVEAEEKTFTFKLENGALNIYEHKNWDSSGNDFVGFVEPHQNFIQTPTDFIGKYTDARDERLADNNAVSSVLPDNLIHNLGEDAQNLNYILLKSENQSQAEQIKGLQGNDTKLTKYIESMSKKITTIEKDIQKFNKELISVKDVASHIQDKNEILLSRQAELIGEIDVLERKLMSSTSSNIDLQSIVSELRGKLFAIGIEITTIKTKYETTVDIEKKQLKDTLNTLIIDLEKDISGKNGTKESFQKRLDVINAQAYSTYPKAGRKMIQDMIQTFSSPEYERGPITEEDPDFIGVKNQERITDFRLNNPIKLLDWNKELLPKIESKGQLIELLKKFQDVRFPDSLTESTLYTYAVQCAISLIDPQNTLGSIDGLWGNLSTQALKEVQKGILGFQEDDVDGKPGPNTVTALIKKLAS